MTDRNELERLLAAATEGPWEPEYDPIGDSDEHATAICLPGFAGQIGTFIAYCQHNWNDAYAGEHRISWKEATSNAALICFLRNNAQHYLSLMDEVERLRNRWAMIDKLREEEGCSVEIIHDNPDPGGSNCAIRVTSDFGEDYTVFFGDTIDDCLSQALGETHDN